MMRNNSNSSIKILCLFVIMMVSGCSDTPTKEPLVMNDQSDYETSKSYSTSVAKQQPRLHFKKRIKNTSGHYETVWDRMLSLYSFPEINNERIDRELYWYLSHRDYLARIQERAAPYMHLILDEIEEKNLPGELALLPVIESAFIPEAYSKSAASGLWQFIPATGRLYGLEQNSWYDGRRDVYASTVAATSFLKDLGEEFGNDWCLALASYNFGKGNVGKAIDRNDAIGLPTDYWSLDLPKETEDYVPRLMAIAKLFANAEQYNVHLQNIPNKPYCEVVNVGSQLDLDKAAELADTSLSHIMKLNPGIKKGTTAPDGPHHLLIPASKAQSFRNKLAHLPYDERVDDRQEEELLAQKIHQNELAAQKMRDEEERRQEHRRQEIIAAKITQPSIPTQRYFVRPGETLTAIAKKSGTNIGTLRQINSLSKATVNSGTYLKIPASARISETAEISRHKATSGGQVYVVKKGDTFFNVSKRFAVSRSDIANWNNISPNSNLKLGQRLTIKSGGQQVASVSSTRLIRYHVKPGDSLMQLTRKFGVSLDDIRRANPETVSKGLRPGQNLKIVVNNHPST